MTELKKTIDPDTKLTTNNIKLFTLTTNLVDSIAHNLLLLTLDNFTIFPEAHYRDLLAREESFEGGLVVLNHASIVGAPGGQIKIKLKELLEASPSYHPGALSGFVWVSGDFKGKCSYA